MTSDDPNNGLVEFNTRIDLRLSLEVLERSNLE